MPRHRTKSCKLEEGFAKGVLLRHLACNEKFDLHEYKNHTAPNQAMHVPTLICWARALGDMFASTGEHLASWASLRAAIIKTLDERKEADPYCRKGCKLDAVQSSEKMATALRVMMSHCVDLWRHPKKLQQKLKNLKRSEDRNMLLELMKQISAGQALVSESDDVQMVLDNHTQAAEIVSLVSDDTESSDAISLATNEFSHGIESVASHDMDVTERTPKRVPPAASQDMDVTQEQPPRVPFAAFDSKKSRRANHPIVPNPLRSVIQKSACPAHTTDKHRHLPEGWARFTKTRKTGSTKGHVDVYYRGPNNKVCRSLAEVARYQKTL